MQVCVLEQYQNSNADDDIEIVLVMVPYKLPANNLAKQAIPVL